MKVLFTENKFGSQFSVKILMYQFILVLLDTFFHQHTIGRANQDIAERNGVSRNSSCIGTERRYCCGVNIQVNLI